MGNSVNSEILSCVMSFDYLGNAQNEAGEEIERIIAGERGEEGGERGNEMGVEESRGERK